MHYGLLLKFTSLTVELVQGTGTRWCMEYSSICFIYRHRM